MIFATNFVFNFFLPFEAAKRKKQCAAPLFVYFLRVFLRVVSFNLLGALRDTTLKRKGAAFISCRKNQ